jgi:hypothetical protein
LALASARMRRSSGRREVVASCVCPLAVHLLKARCRKSCRRE